MNDRPDDNSSLRWRPLKAPSLAEFEVMAIEAFRKLPDNFRALCTDLAADCPPRQVLGHAMVREAIVRGLARHNKASGGSSMEIARLILMHEPPSIDANEITDKGYINQRAVLQRRAELVERLYAEPVHGDVIVVRSA